MPGRFYIYILIVFCLTQISFAAKRHNSFSPNEECSPEPVYSEINASRNTSVVSPLPGNENSLRVLSYNVKGLPPVATPGYGQERFSEIARILNMRLYGDTAPDVILLQEVFTRNAQQIISLSGYPYFAHGPTRNGQDSTGCFQKTYSSGIYILSRYPILESGYINYNKSDCATWDCYANKGLQYAVIKVPAQKHPVVVFNTHMQAGSAYDEERSRQLETIKAFVQKKYQNKGIFIFGGDFNTNPSRASFHKLSQELKAENAGNFCLQNSERCRISENTAREEILDATVDHIFYYDKYSDVRITPIEIQRNFKEMYLDQYLSDHFGLEVLFEIR